MDKENKLQKNVYVCMSVCVCSPASGSTSGGHYLWAGMRGEAWLGRAGCAVRSLRRRGDAEEQ